MTEEAKRKTHLDTRHHSNLSHKNFHDNQHWNKSTLEFGKFVTQFECLGNGIEL